MSDTMSLGSSRTTRCWERKARALTIRSSCVNPHGAAFRHTELRAHDADVHVGQFMRIVNVLHAARARDFRHGRAHHLCRRVQRCQFGRGLRRAANRVRGCSGLREVFLKDHSERPIRAWESRNLADGSPAVAAGSCGSSARIDSRLSVLVSIVPPMREVPLAKGLLRQLGNVSFASPGI